MFELLDDARRKAVRETIAKPRYAAFAVLSALLVGVEAGILIGKRDWDPLNWLAVGLNAVVFLAIFAPLFREVYDFLRDREVD
jgi:hypothetical protein